MSYMYMHAADDAHRPPLYGFADTASAAPGTDTQTDGRTNIRTPHRFNMLTPYAVRVTIIMLDSCTEIASLIVSDRAIGRWCVCVPTVTFEQNDL